MLLYWADIEVPVLEQFTGHLGVADRDALFRHAGAIVQAEAHARGNGRVFARADIETALATARTSTIHQLVVGDVLLEDDDVALLLDLLGRRDGASAEERWNEATVRRFCAMIWGWATVPRDGDTPLLDRWTGHLGDTQFRAVLHYICERDEAWAASRPNNEKSQASLEVELRKLAAANRDKIGAAVAARRRRHASPETGAVAHAATAGGARAAAGEREGRRLGTNDVGASTEQETFEQKIQRVLRHLASRDLAATLAAFPPDTVGNICTMIYRWSTTAPAELESWTEHLGPDERDNVIRCASAIVAVKTEAQDAGRKLEAGHIHEAARRVAAGGGLETDRIRIDVNSLFPDDGQAHELAAPHAPKPGNSEEVTLAPREPAERNLRMFMGRELDEATTVRLAIGALVLALLLLAFWMLR